MMYNKNKKAFTIVELVIVIAVIAILMGIMFVGGSAISNNAKESSLGSDFRTFETNLKAMINDPDATCVQTGTSDTAPFDPDATAPAALIKKYFEGDMALNAAAFTDVPTDADTAAEVTRGAYEVALTMNDPYGMPYNLVVLDDSSTDVTDLTFLVYSFGKNKQSLSETPDGLFDKDDTGIVIRVVDSVIYTGTFADLGVDAGTPYKDAVDAVAHP